MEEFINEMKKNPALFYSVVAFCAVWGAGALAGIIFVLKHLSRRSGIIKSLQMSGFNPAENNPGALERMKSDFSQKVYKDLVSSSDATGGTALLETTLRKKSIYIEYKPKESPVDLPRASGSREGGGIIKKSVTIKKRFYRSSGYVQSYYAEVSDSITSRKYNSVSTRVVKKWILVFLKKTPYTVKFTISPRSTGWKKMMVDAALALAKAERQTIQGLLPEFEEKFEVSAYTIEKNISFPENIQKKILSFQDCAGGEDIKLILDPEGVWITSSVWPKSTSQFKRMISLCNELIS